jgi:DNA primase
VRQAIQLLLYRPRLVGLIEDPAALADIQRPGAALLNDLVDFLRENPHLNCGAIIEHWRDRHEGRHLAKLASLPVMVPDEGVETEFRGILARLAADRHEQTLDGLLAKSRLGGLTEEEKALLQQVLASRGGGGA